MSGKKKLYFIRLVILTGYFLGGLPLTIWGQWSFNPNYHHFNASILPTNTVYRLLEDPYGFIWMVTDKGILIFNGKTYETIKIPEEDQEIVNVCRYRNTVYATSYPGNLYEINMNTLAVKEIALPPSVANEAIPFKIMNILNDTLFMARSIRSSFVTLNLKKKNEPVVLQRSHSYIQHLVGKVPVALDATFNRSWVKAVNNKIFVSEYIYEINKGVVNVFYNKGKNEHSLKTVSSYLQEGDDLYVGFLQSGGLMRYPHYSSNSGKSLPQTILRDVEVGDILKDRNGNIWVSTIHDGVYVFWTEGQKVQKLSDTHHPFSNDVWYINHSNNLLNVGYKQLVVDQLQNGRCIKRWVGDTTINFNPVHFFNHHGNKAIIFGKSSNYTTYDNTQYRDMRYAYKDLYTRDGELFATIPGGFRKFSKELDPVFFQYSADKFNTIFLLPDSVYAKGGSTGLYLNNTPTNIKERVTKVRGYNKDILASTDNGIYIKRGDQYIFINETDGLPGNQCLQMEYDGGRYYKILTKGGLAYIDTGTLKVSGVFHTQSLGNDFSVHHFDVKNDSVWMATNKGIYVLNEQFLFNKATRDVPVYLYPEQLSNRVRRYTTQAFEIPYNKTKQVRMVIEVLDFSPKKPIISYQVEKDGDTITEANPITTNSFAINTPDPGNYMIKVFIAGDKKNIERTLCYTINIKPLWYQTILARLLLIVAIIIALWGIIRSVTRYIIKEKEKRLKEKYNMLQLQSQAFFTQLNPHFVFNALTPLQSHILKNEKMESLKYLDQFSSLMRDILKNSDKMETSLQSEIDFIEKYVAIQQIRFSPSFGFELNVGPDIDKENTSIPAMMLQPIIENAIEHGVKNKSAEGQIAVYISTITVRGEENLQIQISDNGMGITQNVFKEGHALYILQKRVETLQKQVGLEASLTYEPGPKGIGTTFTLALPKTKRLWTPS